MKGPITRLRERRQDENTSTLNIQVTREQKMILDALNQPGEMGPFTTSDISFHIMRLTGTGRTSYTLKSEIEHLQKLDFVEKHWIPKFNQDGYKLTARGKSFIDNYWKYPGRSIRG